MPRLAPLLSGTEGRIQVELGFVPASRGIVLIDGTVDAAVRLICQRCLEPFRLDTRSRVRLAVLPAAVDEPELEADYEPLVADGGRISLFALVEDEILLNLPLAPMHPREVCPVQLDTGAAESSKNNPFAVLKGLKPGKH